MSRKNLDLQTKHQRAELFKFADDCAESRKNLPKPPRRFTKPQLAEFLINNKCDEFITDKKVPKPASKKPASKPPASGRRPGRPRKVPVIFVEEEPVFLIPAPKKLVSPQSKRVAAARKTARTGISLKQVTPQPSIEFIVKGDPRMYVQILGEKFPGKVVMPGRVIPPAPLPRDRFTPPVPLPRDRFTPPVGKRSTPPAPLPRDRFTPPVGKRRTPPVPLPRDRVNRPLPPKPLGKNRSETVSHIPAELVDQSPIVYGTNVDEEVAVAAVNSMMDLIDNDVNAPGLAGIFARQLSGKRLTSPSYKRSETHVNGNGDGWDSPKITQSSHRVSNSPKLSKEERDELKYKIALEQAALRQSILEQNLLQKKLAKQEKKLSVSPSKMSAHAQAEQRKKLLQQSSAERKELENLIDDIVDLYEQSGRKDIEDHDVYENIEDLHKKSSGRITKLDLAKELYKNLYAAHKSKRGHSPNIRQKQLSEKERLALQLEQKLIRTPSGREIYE